MGNKYMDIAFTRSVRAEQEAQGPRNSYAKREAGEETNATMGAEEMGFIVARDSFYMASVGETGWPYVQHRGGPSGFLKILDDKTLGFADFRGNRQYVSVGNLTADDRVSLFFMDYANRTRLKMFGRVKFTEDPAILERLALPDYPARVERGVLITVEAFDWNCPQHITPRFTEAEMESLVAPLRTRIEELEAGFE